MKPEQKFFLDKKDTLEKILGSLGQITFPKIILNIPRDSFLGKSVKNFQILKRETLKVGKELSVESVDDHILELAALAGIKAFNPVFKTRERVVADIVPRLKNAPVSEILTEENFKEKNKKKEDSEIKIKKSEFYNGEKLKSRVSFRKISVYFFTFVILAFGIFQIATRFLPKAVIAITLKKFPVEFKENIEISSLISNSSFTSTSIALPGELIIAKKNIEMEFSSANKETVSLKAKGVLVVYNAYSSKSQVLVKSTRFESPNKKIFRLDNQVIVPGAKTVEGKIELSQIEVSVTADGAGEEYNIGSVSKWRIPGFEGTPKYDGFYAESIAAMSGGLVGEKAVPTIEEYADAKEKIKVSLQDALKAQMAILLKDEFRLLPNATSFNILKEEIRPQSATAGKFSIFTEAEMKYFVFEEGLLKKVLAEKLEKSTDFENKIRVNNIGLNYGEINVDFKEKRMTFSVNGSIIFVPDINKESLTAELLGKDEEVLKSLVFSLPGLDKARISFWPFWVHVVPKDSNKLNIVIE